MELSYPYVSGDSHLEIDSKNWIDRVPATYRDQAPRVIRTEQGHDAWVVAGQKPRANASDLHGGKGREKWTRDDDRSRHAAIAMNMPVTVHVQLDRSGPRAGPLFIFPKSFEGSASNEAGIVSQVANDKFCRLGGINAVQLMFAGVFDRFPALRLDFAETQSGWLGHFYEQADDRYERHYYWAERLLGMKP